MVTSRTTYKTIDAYIAEFPAEVREILEKMRETIRQAAPEAGETISYGIPTFTFHGNLVHFAAFKNHIGFYPAPRGIDHFEKELAPYIAGKGTIQFPLDRPIPYDLVREVVKFRVQDNLDRAAAKRTKKKSPGGT
jgi:uncharacterized protein YdhG (YjbR/CyaY superfamily)